MPRFGHLNPHDQDPERAQLVQAYMVLQAKQLSVQRRLSSTPTDSSSSSGTASPDNGPEDGPVPATSRTSRSAAPSSPRSPSRRSPYLRRPSVPSIPETLAEHDFGSDEGKLFDINQRIKITLMELLNCESVKTDDRMRMWVQTRLDAQPPLSFRRESSTSSSASSRRRSSAYVGGEWTPSLRSRESSLDEHDGVRKLSL